MPLFRVTVCMKCPLLVGGFIGIADCRAPYTAPFGEVCGNDQRDCCQQRDTEQDGAAGVGVSHASGQSWGTCRRRGEDRNSEGAAQLVGGVDHPGGSAGVLWQGTRDASGGEWAEGKAL